MKALIRFLIVFSDTAAPTENETPTRPTEAATTVAAPTTTEAATTTAAPTTTAAAMPMLPMTWMGSHRNGSAQANP